MILQFLNSDYQQTWQNLGCKSQMPHMLRNPLWCALYGNVGFITGTDCVFLLLPLECLYVFPCQWNYRPDHCMYGSNCREAEREGVSVLHGNRGVYHDEKQPTFKALYEAIRDVSALSSPSSRHLLSSVRQCMCFGRPSL